MKKALLSLAAVACMGASAQAQLSTLYWNFTDNNGLFDSGTPAGYSINAIAPGNSLGTLTPQAVPVSTNMPFNNSSPSSGYSGASGSGNMGNAAATGAFNLATSAYFTFTITPEAGFRLTLQDFDFGVRSTSTGAQSFALYASADSYSNAIFSGSIANSGSWAYKNNTFDEFSFSGATTFRLYLYGGTGNPAQNTVNTRLDDITIQVAAVPEPHEYAIAMAGLLAVVVMGRRMRRA